MQRAIRCFGERGSGLFYWRFRARAFLALTSLCSGALSVGCDAPLDLPSVEVRVNAIDLGSEEDEFTSSPQRDQGSRDDRDLHPDVDVASDLSVEDESGNALLDQRRYQLDIQVRYTDRRYDASGFWGNYIERGAPYVLTQLITERSGSGREEVVTEGYTDRRGEISLTWMHQRAHQGSPSPLWVRVTSIQRAPSGGSARVTSRRRGARYALESQLISLKDFTRDAQGGEDGSPSTMYRAERRLIASKESALSGALNILAMTAIGFELIARHSEDSGPRLTVRWDLDLPVSCGSCYSSDDLTIFLGGQVEDPDHYDDHIILHEMGHFFSDQWSVDSSPGGPHRGRAVSPQLAYGEGLAYFWAALALRDPLIVDWMFPEPWVVDLEGGVYNGEPITLGLSEPYPATPTLSDLSAAHHEELVSTLMWDAYDEAYGATRDDDGDLPPDDLLSLGEEVMMRSLISTLPARHRVSDVSARGVDLADWLDALSCDLVDSEVSAELEREARRRGYPWSSPLHSSEMAGEMSGEMAGELAGEMAGEMAGELAGEMAGELAGEMPRGGRCSLKSDVPRALVTQDEQGALWVHLNAHDPLKSTDTDHTAQTMSLPAHQGWRVQRWRGRPPHQELLASQECATLPCRVSDRADRVMMFRLIPPTTESGLESRFAAPSGERSADRLQRGDWTPRLTSWVPESQALKPSAHSVMRGSDAFGSLLIEQSAQESPHP